MGQAKRRGTLEQRITHAQVRNKLVSDFVAKSDDKQLKSWVSHMGIDKLAQWMEKTGQIQAKARTKEEGRDLMTQPTQ